MHACLLQLYTVVLHNYSTVQLHMYSRTCTAAVLNLVRLRVFL
jgi:hypothetical protein